MSLAVIVVGCTCVCVCALVWRWFKSIDYWESRGVPHLRPLWPLVGNIPDILLMRSLPTILHRIYLETAGRPYVGLHAFHTPVLFVRDPGIATLMLISDFNHFTDRGFHSNLGDPLSNNLIHQTGEVWRFYRQKISMALSDKKVIPLFPIIKAKSEEFLETIEKEQSTSIDIWNASVRYTLDVLSATIIGVEANCLQNGKSPFFLISKQLLGMQFILHVFVGCFFQYIHKIFRMSPGNIKIASFFDFLVKSIVAQRKCSETQKKDLFQKLLENRGSCRVRGLPDWHNSLVGQVNGLFLAGFESTGNTIACILYELAKNPEMQDKLHSEINQVLGACGDEVTYEGLQDMKYLHQVVLESLRLYSPLTLLFRCCTQDYVIPGTSSVVNRGTLVFFPLRSIHEDPDIYPDPTVFNPERFSGADSNITGTQSALYMPFGLGPRTCPGIALSDIEVKSAIVHVLKKFIVEVTKDTPLCYQPDPFKFLLAPKNGLPLAFKRRHS